MVGFSKFRTTFGGAVVLFSTRLLGSAGGGGQGGTLIQDFESFGMI